MKKRGHSIINANVRLFFLLFIVHFLNYDLMALDPMKPVGRYLMDQWDAADGLPGNDIRAIGQTPDGYLWFATAKGLVRFDGIRFTATPFFDGQGNENSKGITPGTLHVDREGNLWIGSFVGLTRYRYQTGEFKTFTVKDGLTGDRIRRIKGDMRGNLWISFAASYLNRFSDGTFTVFNASHGLGGKKVNAMVEDMKGQLLFGTRENGVFKFQDNSFSRYDIKGLDNNHTIIYMHEDHKGRLWIATNKGLFRVNGQAAAVYTTRDGLSDNFTTYILEDSYRNLWVGTINGLNRLKEEGANTFSFETLLKNHVITWLLEDREEGMWVGTSDAGVWQLRDGLFKPYLAAEKFPKQAIFSLFEDRKGDIWIGSVEGRLYRCRGNEYIESLQIANLPSISIQAVTQDSDGNLWLGTNGKGVFQRKQGRFINFTTKDGLADNVVTSIFNDSKNNVWISTFDGVSRFSNGILESFKIQDGLVGKVVNNVYETKDHHILVATDKGINVLENGKLAKENMVTYLKDIPVTCFYQENGTSGSGDEGSVYWIGTHGAGLKRFKNGSFFSYTQADGLDSNFIYQVHEDKQANFWMMSDSGVLRVSKVELNRFADKRIERINCSSFGISDGMANAEFYNPFSRHSALKTMDGELWFVTRQGISIVHPDKIKINRFPPPVVIERVSFNDAVVSRYPKKKVFKDIQRLAFYFTAPTSLAPGKVKFKFKLEGYDNHWVYLPAGEMRVAFYQDLPTGTYTFRVTACNNDGLWNQKGASMVFTLEPLFYQTLLFKIAILLVFLVLGSAAYLVYKNRPFTKKEDKDKGPSLHIHPAFAKERLKKLGYMMDIEKIYRDENISLQSMAEKLSLSPHQLSQLLNENLNKNFWDFINTYRVEEAKRLLIDPKRAHQKILTIAFDVGFNTKASFNQVFKRYTGMTPSQYRKKNKHL